MTIPTLESICVSEQLENFYARIIAEEDIEEDYGKEAILQ